MDESLEARLVLVGQHVAFLGQRTNQAVSEKYLPKLEKDHDLKRYCLKLAKILEGVVKNSVYYAKDLFNIISECDQKDELTEVTKLLETVVTIDETLVGGKSNNEKDYNPKKEPSTKCKTEPKSDSDCDRRSSKKNKKNKRKKVTDDSIKIEESFPDNAILQESVHIDAEPFKKEVLSDCELSDSQATVAVNNAPVNDSDLSDASEKMDNQSNDSFWSKATVKAPSPKSDDNRKKQLEIEENSDLDETIACSLKKDCLSKKSELTCKNNEIISDSDIEQNSDVDKPLSNKKRKHKKCKKSKKSKSKNDKHKGENEKDLSDEGKKIDSDSEEEVASDLDENNVPDSKKVNISTNKKGKRKQEEEKNEKKGDSSDKEQKIVSNSSDLDEQNKQDSTEDKKAEDKVEESNAEGEKDMVKDATIVNGDEKGKDRHELTMDSQATCLDPQEITDDLNDIQDVRSGRNSRRSSEGSFVVDVSEYKTADSGTKKQKGSDHISKYETSSPSSDGSDHNIENHLSDQELKETNSSKNNSIEEKTKPIKVQKEKVIRKSLLKVIAEFYKKKKTLRKKKSNVKSEENRNNINLSPSTTPETPPNEISEPVDYNKETELPESLEMEDDSVNQKYDKETNLAPLDISQTTIPATPPSEISEPPMEIEPKLDVSRTTIPATPPSEISEPMEMEHKNIKDLVVKNQESNNEQVELDLSQISNVMDEHVEEENTNVTTNKSSDNIKDSEQNNEILEENVDKRSGDDNQSVFEKASNKDQEESKHPNLSEEVSIAKENTEITLDLEKESSFSEEVAPEGSIGKDDTEGSSESENEQSPVEMEHCYQKKVSRKHKKENNRPEDSPTTVVEHTVKITDEKTVLNSKITKELAGSPQKDSTIDTSKKQNDNKSDLSSSNVLAVTVEKQNITDGLPTIDNNLETKETSDNENTDKAHLAEIESHDIASEGIISDKNDSGKNVLEQVEHEVKNKKEEKPGQNSNLSIDDEIVSEHDKALLKDSVIETSQRQDAVKSDESCLSGSDAITIVDSIAIDSDITALESSDLEINIEHTNDTRFTKPESPDIASETGISDKDHLGLDNVEKVPEDLQILAKQNIENGKEKKNKIDIKNSHLDSSGNDEQGEKGSGTNANSQLARLQIPDTDSQNSDIASTKKKLQSITEVSGQEDANGKSDKTSAENVKSSKDDEPVNKDGETEEKENRQIVSGTDESNKLDVNDKNVGLDVLGKDLVLTQTAIESSKENEDNQKDTAISSNDTEEYTVNLEKLQTEMTDVELNQNNEDDIVAKDQEMCLASLEESQVTKEGNTEGVVSKKRKLSQGSTDGEENPSKNAKLNSKSNLELDNSQTPRDDEVTDKEKNSNEEESETEDKNFKLDDQERDELLNLLDDHFKNINEDLVENLKPPDTESIVSQASKDGSEINRNLLMELLEEYEQAVATGKDMDLEGDQPTEQGDAAPTQNEEEDAAKEIKRDEMGDTTKEIEREGSNTPEPLLQLVKEEEFVQYTPRKRLLRKSEFREAAEIYRKLMEDDSDCDSSSTSAASSPTKSVETEDHSDVDNPIKKPKFRVSKQLLEENGIDKELIVKIAKSDIGDGDFTNLPKSAKEAVDIDRLCDISNILQQRKRLTSASDPEMTKKKRGKKKRQPSRTDSPSLFSDSDVDESDTSSRPHSTIGGGLSPVNYHSDDSQEAMARAFLDRMKGDSSDENSPTLSGLDDSNSDIDEKDKKKNKRDRKNSKSLLETGDIDVGSDKEEDDKTKGKEEEGEKERNKDEDKKKTPKSLTAEEKRKKRWKRDPLLHSKMLSGSSSDDDSANDSAGSTASAGSAASRRRRKRMDKLKFKYEVKSTDSEWTDSDPVSKKSRMKAGKKVDTSDSDSSSVEFVSTKMKTPVKTKKKKDSSETTETEDEAEESPSKGKGRRNIRELLADEALAVDTKKANEEEKKRVKRLEEKKTQRETFSQSQSFGSSQEDDMEALVLDIDKTTLEPLIKVHPKITRKLKPHQREGIQFMWDSCYESCDQMKTGWTGSGCILAHCMGLGKTLQVLGLVHTIFSYPDVTKTKHVLVVCPLSTVSNWRNEYKLAYKNIDSCCNINIFTIEDKKTKDGKFEIIKRWRRRGGILVMGYEAFGNLINDSKLDKWQKQRLCSKQAVLEALVDPGPDLVVCDEGHLLKNKQTQRNISLNKVKTRRRIVLTGTPLQNNLIEYYCMVNFVKPNLLGNEKEYKTNFVNPITNGQYEDSNLSDIKLMKYRTHVLYRKLKDTVQRVEDTELKKYLPKLVDYALFIQISDMQIDFYNTYLDLAAENLEYNKEGNLCQKNFLADVLMTKYICSHPYLLSVVDKKGKKKIKEQDVIDDQDDEQVRSTVSTNKWWRNILPADAYERLELGHKIWLALTIVEEAEALGEKVLIFSQNHGEMDVLEHFLSTKGTKGCPHWQKRYDYYRMDGTIAPEERAIMCNKFNDPKNKKLRLLIMSTKVGGLGLNLTAANRIVIMNVNWNPSYDTQSVFRAYRFGQEKAVFVYRLISMQTMEEKIYQRSVTKLAVAHRVVDKHQIKRAYSKADIEEMYGVRPSKDADRPVPNYPEDDELLAKLLQKHKFIHRWHEHQGLLANRPEEDLNDQEKELAWEEFNRKQVAPPPPQGFGMPAMPNMGVLAMNMYNAVYGGANPADFLNSIDNYGPKFDEHSYSLPTNVNTLNPESTAQQPTNLGQLPIYNPRVLFPSRNDQPSTSTANLNLPRAPSFNMANVIKNYANANQPINLGSVPGNRVPTPSQVPTMIGSANIGTKGPRNWLTSQVANVGPHQPLRFSMKTNFANEQGMRSLAWPGIKVNSRGGMTHFYYRPPEMPATTPIDWVKYAAVAPDGNVVTVWTRRDDSNSAGSIVKDTDPRKNFVPIKLGQSPMSQIVGPNSTSQPGPVRIVRKVVPPLNVGTQQSLAPGQKISSSHNMKQVVPNPFNPVNKNNLAPALVKPSNLQAARNSIKAAGLTGTKHVVPNPLSSQVRLSGAASPKTTVAPPPAHTVVRSPRLAATASQSKSLDNVSPRNPVDLTTFKNTSPTAASSKSSTNRSQNLTNSSPNQNFNENLKTAVNNFVNGARSSPRTNNLTNSTKASGGAVYVPSSRRGTKRSFDTVNNAGGANGTKGPVPIKRLIIPQNNQSNTHTALPAMPALTPRPTVAPITNLPADPTFLYKEMLKNLQGGTSFSSNKGSPARTRLQTQASTSTSSQQSSQLTPTSSNKENRRNRLQLNRTDAVIDLEAGTEVRSGPVNLQTLEKLKEKGVSVNKVDKIDSGIIQLD